MMCYIIILVFCLILVHVLIPPATGQELFRSDFQVNVDGNNGYTFYYDEYFSHNQRVEKGEFVNGVWTVIGSVSYRDKENNLFQFDYSADDKGFRRLPYRSLQLYLPSPPPASGYSGSIFGDSKDQIPGGEMPVDKKSRDGLFSR